MSHHNLEPVLVFITLGSNIAPEQNLPRAVKMIQQNYHLRLCNVSRVYASAPINSRGEVAPDQPEFLNAAVLVQSDGYFSALKLKFHTLRFIEFCLGRQRGPDKFAPRPIDLDIALYGDQVIETPHLVIPDPDLLRRAHVALPLADLMPDFKHPVTGQTLAQIAAPFVDQPGITICTGVRLDSTNSA
ncbi:MAG: 2-amino-4-hydroxy-6-hydroxymethyldihydropteridine diphosphokinase [Chloroflexi bacterium]|nr:2-amino-4-hydroxy-6-hydroxymethyldihydropteridine diphosphokinase [Chloroflexota bacterium]